MGDISKDKREEEKDKNGKEHFLLLSSFGLSYENIRETNEK